MTTTRQFRHYLLIGVVFFEALLLILLGRGFDGLRGFALGFGIACAAFMPILLVAEARLSRRKEQNTHATQP